MTKVFSNFVRITILLFIGITHQSTFAQSVGGLKAIDLRVEYLKNPVGIDITEPRLSWALTSEERAQNQSTYQIVRRRII